MMMTMMTMMMKKMRMKLVSVCCNYDNTWIVWALRHVIGQWFSQENKTKINAVSTP